ncbi:MAG: SMP-30/gluconolactonase/LRE family protein [Actinomycetota bacterium]|jgi:sugar lactone lactonase YvrE
MFVSRSRTRVWVVPFVAAALVVVAAGAVQAQATVQVVTSFDEAQGQNPEGIAINRTGSIFVSVSPLGDVWRIPPGSDDPQPFGHVDGITPGADFGLLGLAVDVFGNVYGAVQSANPDANGVWRFDRSTGDATRLPGTAAMGIPNGLAFDKQMNLYVTDSARGAIWRIPWDGDASIWLQDPTLTGDGSLGLGLGANGIAVQRGVFTVTNTERRTILRIPKVGGEPGSISVLTTLPAGDNPDGVTMDVFGDAFVAMNLANAIAKVRPSGSMSVVASGDPLDFPSSVVFGTARGQRMTIYGVNFSISELFNLPPGDGPGVFRFTAGVPGMPVP